MRIWIDGYEANVQQRVGSGQVAFELLKNIEILDKENEYTILLTKPPISDLPKARKNWKYKIIGPSKLKTLISVPLALYTSLKKPDLIFSPTHYIPRFSPVKRVVTIFDLAFLHFPEMFPKKDLIQLTSWTKFSVLKSDHIITISNFSKQDIIKQYGVQEDKISVAYPGFDKKVFRQIKDKTKVNKIVKKYDIRDNYIIYIGTLQPRKNLIRLFEAFSSLESNNLKLVIVGKTSGPGREGWMYQDILEAPKKLGIKDKVIFTGFVNSENLPFLLTGAKAFVLPSLWEGFGIPVIEAMACGTPVITSNVSSLPEIVGDAGLTVNPYSVDEIKNAIQLLVNKTEFNQKYSNLGLEQAKKYSWERMAEKVLKVFTQI
ncbi:glycosyltransferase family 4 protein [Candidatus Daviesbacteria bacterium]|nr:glycosyltransferase family 4 protein [Candidatus Daviesbacteria bacterium]